MSRLHSHPLKPDSPRQHTLDDRAIDNTFASRPAQGLEAELLRAFGFGLFVIALVRTAWLCDDAYITLRTIDNFVAGYGVRWNVVERVQTYTHPLWMLMLSVPYYFTRDPYFTPLLVSMVLSALTVWLLLTRLAVTPISGALGALVLTVSKAFVDYSTSGLENPLTHLLLATFFMSYWRSLETADLTLPWLACGLLLLNRLDTGLLVLPALLVRGIRMPWRRVLRAAAIGLAPLMLWEVFAIVYYGFPFPNTAYAKLQHGISESTLIGQGLLYLLDSIAEDPVTLLATAAFTAAVLRVPTRKHWPFAVGILLYYAYVVRIGGDFMSGRFLAAPLFVAVALFVRLPIASAARVAPAVAAVCIVLGIIATKRPPIMSDADTFVLTPNAAMGVAGVADERAYYYRYTGLLRWTREVPLPHNATVDSGRQARNGPLVVVRSTIGLFGYYAGPTVHVVDAMGLGDPLLARLPAEGRWRIGHFEREIPEGYVATLETGENKLVDPAVGARYQQLKLITQGPLWARRRWRAIAAVAFGL